MLLCRAELAVRGLVATAVTSYRAGLLLLTNKQLHTLAISGQETEEPADWLQPQVGTEPSLGQACYASASFASIT